MEPVLTSKFEYGEFGYWRANDGVYKPWRMSGKAGRSLGPGGDPGAVYEHLAEGGAVRQELILSQAEYDLIRATRGLQDDQV